MFKREAIKELEDIIQILDDGKHKACAKYEGEYLEGFCFATEGMKKVIACRLSRLRKTDNIIRTCLGIAALSLLIVRLFQ